MIESLTIANLKCFDRQTIALRPLTLLSGLNGMGKSTVIQSLLLLRQSVLRGTLEAGEPGANAGESSEEVARRRRGLLLNGDLVQLGTGLDVLFEGAEREEIEL